MRTSSGSRSPRCGIKRRGLGVSLVPGDGEEQRAALVNQHFQAIKSETEVIRYTDRLHVVLLEEVSNSITTLLGCRGAPSHRAIPQLEPLFL